MPTGQVCAEPGDPQLSDPLIGVVLQQTYRLDRLIGRGGMGAVYEASHLRLQRSFAVKLLAPGLGHASQQLYSRFYQEAQITSGLGHPNIVEVVDFNVTEEGTPFIVMELLFGSDLDELLKVRGALDLAHAVTIVAQAASALHAVHEQGIVHRDLKPSNIFLNRLGDDEQVKLLDFGISKVLDGAAHAAQTRGGDLVGTPSYMAPEQAEAREDREVCPRTDLFALGTILYTMLGGEQPFAAASVPQILYRIVHEEPPLLSDLDDLDVAVTPEVSRVVARAMAKDPAQRYASMAAFVEALAVAAPALQVRFAPQTRPVRGDNTAQQGLAQQPTLAVGSTSITQPPLDSPQTGPLPPQTGPLPPWTGPLPPSTAPPTARPPVVRPRGRMLVAGLAAGVGLVVASLLIAALLLGRSADGDKAPVDPALDLARQALARGDLEPARAVASRGEEAPAAQLLAGRLALSERRLDDARRRGEALLGGAGAQRLPGQILQADLLLIQGRVTAAVKLLEVAAAAAKRPSEALELQMRLGDLCQVMRRRGCSRHAYQRAAETARRAGAAPAAARARLLSLVLDVPPGRAPTPQLRRALEAAGKPGAAAQLPASELSCIRAWAELRQGKRLQAARRLAGVAKGIPAFRRFRLMTAEGLLALGRGRAARALLAPLIANPAGTDDVAAGIAGLFVASRAARQQGHTVAADRLGRAFLRHWGGAEADLLESSVWRKRVKQTRRLLRSAGASRVLYGLDVRLAILTGDGGPALARLEERLARQLRARFEVETRAKAVAAASARAGRSGAAPWRQGRAPRAGTPAALVQLVKAGAQSVQVKRLRAEDNKEVARATLLLPVTEAQLADATLQLFPRPAGPLRFGELVAGRFERCNPCLRRTMERAGVTSAGAELTLRFGGDGRLLPSRVRKVVPDATELTVCLRGCVEQLRVPPFGRGADDRLEVDVFVSIERDWAMLRTVPRLRLARR